MYNPQISYYTPSPSDYTAGQSKANATISGGNSIAQGLNRWFENDRQDTQTRAQVAGLLPTYGNDFKNPEDQKLIEKFINHKSNYKDNAYLLGVLTTNKQAKEDQQRQQFGAMQLQALQSQQAERQRQIRFGQQLDAQNANPYIFNNATQNDPYLALARGVRGATGQTMTPESLATNVIGKEIAAATRPPIAPIKYDDVVNGVPTTITRDPRSGQVIGSAPARRAYASPEEQALTASLTTQATEQAKNASELVTGITNNAETAQAQLPRFQQIKDLYAKGVSSGFGQDAMNTMSSAAFRLGLVKPGELADKEQLGKLLASDALTNAAQMLKGQGSVSDNERKSLAAMSAELGKSPQANLRILAYSEAIARRSVDMEKERQRLADQDFSLVKQADHLRRWRMDHPVGTYISKEDNSAMDAPVVHAGPSTPSLPDGWKIVP